MKQVIFPILFCACIIDNITAFNKKIKIKCRFAPEFRYLLITCIYKNE